MLTFLSLPRDIPAEDILALFALFVLTASLMGGLMKPLFAILSVFRYIRMVAALVFMSSLAGYSFM
jgi:hypothetical protein